MRDIKYFKFISLYNKLINSFRKEVRLRRKIERELILRLEKLLRENKLEIENNNQETILLRNFLQWKLHNTRYNINSNKNDIKFIKNVIKDYPLG